MFGHQDDVNNDNQQPMSDGASSSPPWAQDPAIPAQGVDAVAPSAPPVQTNAVDTPSSISIPTVNNDRTGEYLMDTPHDQPSTPTTNANGNGPAVDASVHANEDDLLDIKQQALQQLTPLVGHLDQTPEEKFRTTMMMIQASDNKALLQEAYDAAQSITDEKARAQALLDVVNEINYFTQQHDEHEGTA